MHRYLCCIACLISGACGSTLKERYYVAVVDEKSDSMQIYRYDLYANAGLSKVNFTSDWYDGAALDALANKHVNRFEMAASEASEKDQRLRYFIAGPKGRFRPNEKVRLAIIMASDPKPITEALRQISNSEQLKSIASEIVSRRSKDDSDDSIMNEVRTQIKELIKGHIKALTKPS